MGNNKIMEDVYGLYGVEEMEQLKSSMKKLLCLYPLQELTHLKL